MGRLSPPPSSGLAVILLLQSEPTEIGEARGEARASRGATSQMSRTVRDKKPFIGALTTHLGCIQGAAPWENAAPLKMPHLRPVRCLRASECRRSVPVSIGKGFSAIKPFF